MTKGPIALLAGLAALAVAGRRRRQDAHPVSGPADWSAFKAHADKAYALAGPMWKPTADYFCQPARSPT
ncbi:MAG: hypothetical protein WDN45_11950 [Caulobacteraceae bacterium]